MAFSLHGIRLPHKKNTANMQAVKMPAPGTVTIPMQMHIGKPATPTVKVGDKVYVGTLIGEADARISAPIHSSISGTVKKIDQHLTSAGTYCQAVIIESDGEMAIDPSIVPPSIDSKESFIEALRRSGIVGLGGAGFPVSVKYDVPDGKIDEFIINGAECEPYITSDTQTMIERTDDIKLALDYVKKYLGVTKIIIGIEKNKPAAIASMKALAAEDPTITVKALSSIYPQGGEKVLIYHLTGKTVPVGKLPIDVGCVVSNCTTVADIGKFIKTGMPLTEKCVTVDGSAVAHPMNVIAPIGTALADVFAFTGGYKEAPHKILYGGPMMGISVPSENEPVLKNTNAILAFNKKDAILKKPQPCIKCGRCINACPFGINPPAISRALSIHDYADMEKFGADACMECGCCSFVCPANRPLVQNNKLAKAELRDERAKKKAKESKNQ